VLYEGVWAADGERYRILMQPGSHRPHAGSNAGNNGSSSGSSGVATAAPKKLRVGAQHVPREPGAPPNAEGAGKVAAGIAEFFTNMAIDLDGIEISRPVLSLRPWRSGGSSSGSSGSSSGDQGDVLDIKMSVRIRAFPPLNMQF
jgi:hypothetical protein